MRIYIPTRGRADRQYTLRNLPPSVDVVLVVPQGELRAHEHLHAEIISPPSTVRRIAPTRQWILREHARIADSPFFAMMDDDLEFAVRRTDDPGKFLPSGFKDTIRMLYRLEKLLTGGLIHAGIMARELNYAPCTDYTIRTTRMMRALAYNAEVLLKEGVRFDRTQTMDDFDMTLQLLRHGYDNAVVATHVQNQRGGSGASGGAAVYRSVEVHNGSALKLAKLHAPFVRVVEKKTKSAWGGFDGTRLDVVVSWKKAYASSQC